MAIVYVLLVAHFIGDFICQSDWMAVNKSKRWDALAAHVGVYIAVVGLIVAFTQPPAPYPYLDAALFAVWLTVNAAAHFMQDAVTGRINARLWFLPKVGEGMRPNWIQVEVKDTRHWFFVGIGADQLLHYVTLFVTAGWWLR